MKKLLTTLAITAALVGGVSLPATAATSHGGNAAVTVPAKGHPHVLDYLCGHAPKGKPCTVLVETRLGPVLKVRDQKGTIHRFTDSASAIRYLGHRVPACQEEDSNACIWIASQRGNGIGDDFITIGRGTTTDRTLPQYGHGVLVLFGELD